jgi:hypothetical protein
MVGNGHIIQNRNITQLKVAGLKNGKIDGVNLELFKSYKPFY